MRFTLKTLALALIVALLCVPAAFAKGKPSWAGGGSNGQGHGKPTWAGHGKPDWAGKADAKKAKHEKQHGAQSVDTADLTLDDLNPAWYCKTIESMLDQQDADAVAGDAEAGDFSSFDSEFGTNDNKRNSFGKCVSRRTHGEDLSGVLGDEQDQSSCDQPANDGSEDAAAEEGAQDAAAADDPAADDPAADDPAADDPAADDPAADDPADDGSDDQADEAADCQTEDAAGEEDQAEQDGQVEAPEAAAFARALVSFLRL
jgi:hypothetical protein